MVQTFKARAWTDADGSGEFAIPEVDDGTYLARILDVEDREFPGYDGGDPQLKYMVDWELKDMFREDGKPATLRQFVTVPQGLIDKGYVHPKSNLYAFMGAIGLDPKAEDFEVDPFAWIGKQAMIWVKNKPKVDKVTGETTMRPNVVDVSPKKAQAAAHKAKYSENMRAAPPPPADWDEPEVQ